MNRLAILVVTSAVAAATCRAEFAPPTPSQVADAAANPDGVPGLLKEANAEQAAQVVHAVIVEIVALKLSPEVQTARISAAIGTVFGAIPKASWSAFASALGTLVAATPATAATAISAVAQTAITKAGGAEGAALGAAFGNAFAAALKASASLGNGPQDQEQVPAPQTVAEKYEAQNQ